MCPVEYENTELKYFTNNGKIFKNSISKSWPFGNSNYKSFYLSLFMFFVKKINLCVFDQKAKPNSTLHQVFPSASFFRQKS